MILAGLTPKPRKALTLLLGAIVAGFASAPPSLAGDLLSFDAVFQDPWPQRDPANPYSEAGPIYSGIGTQIVTWGMAHLRLPELPGVTTLVNASRQVYADHFGNLATLRDGSPWILAPTTMYDPVTNPTGFAIEGDPAILEGFTSGLDFVPWVVDAAPGDLITIGGLAFRNGDTGSGTSINSITLDLEATIFTEAGSMSVSRLSLPIALVNTPNTGKTAYDAADYLYFPAHPEFGSLRVFEGTTSFVTLLGRYGSLEFAGFGEVLDGTGFLAPIPEPATVGWISGLGLVAFALGRRRPRPPLSRRRLGMPAQSPDGL